jgi:TonB-linked SusC/RagA family outer membrane protein
MRRILLLILLLGVTSVTWAQSVINVLGVVRDEQGEGIIGATVTYVEKGVNKGAITDADGQFRLTGVDPAAQLLVSFVGMESVQVKAKPKLDITLRPNDEVLDEVIVTAFGTAKKSSFTGSAAVVGTAKIEQKQLTNVMQSLVGEVPGLQINPSTAPGSTQSMTIRGTGSIYADSDPLIIVDGMPFDGGWNNINPQDVASVTVLKDAASNALYGARGANGVVIITTKNGSAGKAVVTVDAKWGVNQRSVPDYDRITNVGEYYEMFYKALYNYYTNGQGNTATVAHQRANESMFAATSEGGLGYNVYTVPTNEYLIGTNGKLNPNATLGRRVYRDGKTYTLYPDNWSDETYHTGQRQEYNASISGGNSQAQVYGSFGYLNDGGIVASSDYERYTARLRASYQAKPWLNFGGNMSYVRSETGQVYADGSSSTDGQTVDSNVFSFAANMAPIYPLYVRDGNGKIISDANGKMYDWGDGKYNSLDSDGNVVARPYGTNTNLINSLSLDANKHVDNSLNADGYVDVSFLKDFKFTFKTGTSVWESAYTYTSNPYYGYYNADGGVLTKTTSRTTTLNMQELLNWSHSYGKNNLTALIGHENYKYNYEILSATKRGATDYFGNQQLDGYLTYPDAPSSSASDYNTEGYFFRATYDYDTRYFGQASFRRDASSRFHPDNRWGNFWSVGGAWLMSKEGWFNLPNVGSLKLKASYGEQGNDKIGNYRYMDLYTVSNVDGQLSLTLYQKGNKDITWETGHNFNVGVEWEMYKGRFTGGVDFYNRTTEDMLLWFSTPNTLGYSGYYKNVGDMRNRGVELTLAGTPIRTRHIDWSLSFNMTYNDQAVTYLPTENKTASVDGYNGFINGTNYFVGEDLPLNSFYIAKYAGVSDEGLSQWYYTDANGEKQKTTSFQDATKYIIKAEQPVYGGFGSSLNLYGVDVNVQFTYQLGGRGLDTEYALLMTNPTISATGYAIHKDMLKAWSEDNTDSNIPRWQFADENTGAVSDRYLIKNSYLALQNVQIGYTVPQRFYSALGLSKVRLYASGDNLYLWSKRKGYDPRISSGYGVYSPMRTISGGINIQF